MSRIEIQFTPEESRLANKIAMDCLGAVQQTYPPTHVGTCLVETRIIMAAYGMLAGNLLMVGSCDNHRAQLFEFLMDVVVNIIDQDPRIAEKFRHHAESVIDKHDNNVVAGRRAAEELLHRLGILPKRGI